jgi:purine-cytosine permease-like protein
LGVAIGTLVLDPSGSAAYEKAGLGGLIGFVFEGHGSGVRGFGTFIELILGFSTVAVVVTNIYSLGLSAQMVTTKAVKVPRFVWSLLGGAIFLAAAIAGRDKLETVMENFLLICAYWITPFSVILLLEHFVWRRNYEYDLSAWNDRTKLPIGIAASIVFIIGTVLSLLCMSQTWWVGPIAKSIGTSPFGTDISWILAVAVCTALYIPLRMWERKKWGL